MNATPIISTSSTAQNSTDPGATLDVPKMAQNSKAGVILSEQQTVQQTLPNEYNLTVLNRRANTHLNDNAWDLESMLSRHNYVDTVPWDTTTNPGQVLFSARVIEGLLKLDINSFPFKRYNYWRAENVTVHFQVTANRFLAGRLIAYFVPSMAGNPDVSLRRAVLLQHVFLDPSAASAVELVIPFNYFKGYIDLNQGDNLGIVELAVFNSLTAAVATTPNIDVKVYMSVKGSEFKVPLPGSVSFSRSIRKHSSLLASLDEGFQALTESIMPTKIISDVIGGLLDKPEEPEQPAPIANKDQEYLSNSRGAEFLEKLSLDPSAQQVVDTEHFSTNQDEMDIDYLLQKKMSFLRRIPWLQTDAVGTILFYDRVGPLLNLQADLEAEYGTRLVDYVACNFHYWKGGLKYIFDVVGTQLHEGRLDVMFIPGYDTPVTDYKAATSVYMGSVVIRNGENSFAFVAPFLSDTPYRRVYHGGKLGYVSPDLRIADYSSGIIQLVVANQLRAPTNVPANVTINAFQSVASDFELTIPSVYNHSLKIKSLQIQKHGSNTMPNLNNPADQISAAVLAAGAGFSHEPSTTQFGESYKSLRELCKRYQSEIVLKCDPSVLTNADIKAAILSGSRPFITTIEGRDLIGTQFFCRIINMYRTIRGSLRAKVRSRLTTYPGAINPFGYVTYFPTPATATIDQLQDLADHFVMDQGGVSSIPRARFSTTQTAEFETPFLHHTGVALIRRESEELTPTNTPNFWNPTLIVAVFADFTKPIFLDVQMAFGDHTRLGTFYDVPDLIPTVGATGISLYPDLWVEAPPPISPFDSDCEFPY